MDAVWRFGIRDLREAADDARFGFERRLRLSERPELPQHFFFLCEAEFGRLFLPDRLLPGCSGCFCCRLQGSDVRALPARRLRGGFLALVLMHELCILELADMLFDRFLKACLAPFASNRRFICGSIGKARRTARFFKCRCIRFSFLSKLCRIGRAALRFRTGG